MRLACVAALAAALALTACGRKEPTRSPGASSPAEGSGSSAMSPSSPNPAGLNGSRDQSAALKKLMETTCATAKEDPSKVRDIVRTFVLPNYESWFRKTFTEDTAKGFVQNYARLAPELETMLVELWTETIAGWERSDVEVFSLADPNDAMAVDYGKEAALAMKEKTALYSVQISERGGSAQSLWFWVYVDGGFRFIGKGH